MVWIISPLINQAHNLKKIQNKIKFGKKCVQEHAKERLYGWDDFFRYRNNNAAETAAICDTTFIL